MLLLIMMIIDDDNGDGDDGDNHDADHLPLVGMPGHHDRVPSRLRPHKSRRVELLDVRLRYHHLYHLSCKISSLKCQRVKQKQFKIECLPSLIKDSMFIL